MHFNFHPICVGVINIIYYPYIILLYLLPLIMCELTFKIVQITKLYRILKLIIINIICIHAYNYKHKTSIIQENNDQIMMNIIYL